MNKDEIITIQERWMNYGEISKQKLIEKYGRELTEKEMTELIMQKTKEWNNQK